MAENEKEKMEIELSDLRGKIKDLDFLIETLDQRLAPYWTAERQIRASVLASHDMLLDRRTVQTARGPRERTIEGIGFRQDGRPEREPLYEKYIALAATYGHDKIARQELESRRTSYQAHAKSLATAIQNWKASKPAKPEKPPKAQGSLF